MVLALAGVLALPSGASADAASSTTGRNADRNGDGLPDKWEKRYGLSLRLRQGSRDQDRDGLRNRDEYRQGTNPRYRDTDNDRLLDGDELSTGNDPLDRDTDGDKVEDGRENPGRVVTFTDGVLVLELSGGERVSAAVTADTEITCLAPSDADGDEPGAGRGDVAGGDRVLARTDYAPERNAPRSDGGPTADIGNPRTACDQSDLVPGAIVHEADLRLVDGALVARSVTLRAKS